jgi:hypothetical protein
MTVLVFTPQKIATQMSLTQSTPSATQKASKAIPYHPSAAMAHMLLVLHTLSDGSCWMIDPLVAQQDFGAVLGYAKEKFIR